MEQTLLKVKNLEKFVKEHGEDVMITQTISKMIAYKVQRYAKEIESLEGELEKFEQTYKKETRVFFEEFKAGRLGDEMAFIEWSSLYQMRNRLLDKKTELESMI